MFLIEAVVANEIHFRKELAWKPICYVTKKLINKSDNNNMGLGKIRLAYSVGCRLCSMKVTICEDLFRSILIYVEW